MSKVLGRRYCQAVSGLLDLLDTSPISVVEIVDRALEDALRELGIDGPEYAHVGDHRARAVRQWSYQLEPRIIGEP